MLTVRVQPRRGATLRAATATLEVTGVLALGHVWAGGTLPSPAWLALMAAVVFGAGLLVLHGRVRLRYAVPALVATQLLLHAWLTALTPVDTGALAHHPGHVEATLDPAMLGVHAAGALLTAVLWELRARAVDVAVTWTPPLRPPVPLLRRSPVPLAVPDSLISRLVCSVAPRRGPPALLAPA